MADKSCLFLVEDWPLTPDASGGAGPLCYAHLALLVRSGWQVWLVVLVGEKSSKGFARFVEEQPDIWLEVQGWCHHHTLIQIARCQTSQTLWKRVANILRKPDRLLIDPAPRMVDQLQEQVKLAQPTLIWAEHLLPTTVAVQALRPEKVVYSHHDWHWRIKSLRHDSSDWRRRILMRARRRHEEKLVRVVKACITGSGSEGEDIAHISGKPVGYFPITYEPVDQSSQEFHDDVRIVHLGGMQTTANRLGLARFLEISWPLICLELPVPPQLWVVGSLSGASENLQDMLHAADARCTGYVEDLGTVLRSYDLHIIPWEYDTGTRTRIPLAMNRSQVIVSTQAAAACLPELEHEHNCVLTSDLVEMAYEIIALSANNQRRRRLAHASHETFLQNFTVEALQPRLEKFLSSEVELPV
jgi:glycosyltransferase involved in cell wall biosynthesis